MNLSFIYDEGSAWERHLLEHLAFYRTTNFPEATTFYNYLTKKGVLIDFYSRREFTELTFYNVNEELIKTIENELQGFYFTEEDLELERRVILIEDLNNDKSLFDLHTKSYLHELKPAFNTEYFSSVKYSELIEFYKKIKFQKVIFDKKREIEIHDFEKFEIINFQKKVAEDTEIVIFDFKKDVRLRELFILIAYIFADKDLYIQRHNNKNENSLAFKLDELAKLKVSTHELFEEDYKKARDNFDIYFKANSVDSELFDFNNLDTVDDKTKKAWLIDLLKLIYENIE